MEKKLRWFLVNNNYMLQVVASYNHSMAKLALSRNFWECEDWEALKDYRASVIKDSLTQIPEKEWDMYIDVYELLQKGIWGNAWTEEPCLTCWHNCWEWNPQYYNKEIGKFYCKYCDIKECNCNFHKLG